MLSAHTFVEELQELKLEIVKRNGTEMVLFLSFLLGILVWFWYQSSAGLENYVWKDVPFLSFWKEFEKDWY